MFGAWMKGYGEIRAMRVVGSYDDGKACAVRADFANHADFPVVFLFRKVGDKLMFEEFLPGQNPSTKADEKVIAGFLKSWQKAWNSGDAEAVLKQLHPLGKIPLGIAGGLIPKEEIAREFASMVKEHGKIQSTKVKGYKARTNEYVVEFVYDKPAELTAALNLQKDPEGVWRAFQMDLDSGDRALRDPDSWNCQ
jgi:hypothetical protein